jgi:flavin reductase (DIM6/NTAB) family NADH-FMN oxidoreductase RutF
MAVETDVETDKAGQDTFAHFDLAAMSKGDSYKLLASVIMPRPIAWVVSRNAEGVVNAAPFSFFNILSADPPLLAISFSPAPDREGKDSLANIRARREFVVNLVSEELAEAMNVTATNVPRGMDETQLAGLELVKSEVVDVPRIARSPVALECKLFQVIEPGGSSTIMLGRVVYVHVRASAFENIKRLHIDPSQLRLIGRMHGGGGYCTTRDTFTIDRLSWPLEKEI